MKIIISSLGKFHAFQLASQIDKAGYLSRLLTCFYSPKNFLFPEFRKDKEVINLQKVTMNPFPLIIQRGLNRIPCIKKLYNWDYFSSELYDIWASKKLIKSDICVALSSSALYTIREAKKLGVITIVERASSHIIFQKEILEEEYQKYGIKTKPVYEKSIEKELLEYKEADYISIPSTFVKDTFIKKGISENKLIHVSYGVSLENFKKVPKKDNVFRVIFCGGLTLRKGIHYLLKAYKELNLKNSELCLIGSISEEIRPFLKEYEGFYKYYGQLPHYELYKYFSNGSIFVLPSIEDGFGYVVPQAMACGLPVICTSNSGSGDVIRKNIDGFIIPIRDVEALKEKILYLFKNPEDCLKMGVNAESYVRNNFSWEHYGQNMIRAYEKIMSK